MELKVPVSPVYPINRPQQKWVGDSPSELQCAIFAGQDMVASISGDGTYDLRYLQHYVTDFPTMQAAKAAAPEFAREVLSRLRGLIEEQVVELDEDV
ncbi:hypothetical protein ACYPKM_01415 [Pseudomonas aeruginosa]